MAHPPKLRGKLSIEEMERLYHEEKHSIQAIADMYNVTNSAVQTYMRESGVDRRTYNEAKWIQSHKNVNEAFFREWSKEVAYVLGVIVTDGSVDTTTGNLRIQMTDLDIIQKIADAMDLENGITIVGKRQESHKDQYKLAICRSTIVEDLKRLGIVTDGDKTHLQKAVHIPKEFRSAFVRGFYDGDGCLFLRNRITPKGTPSKAAEITFVSASAESLQGVCDMVNDDLGTNITVKSYKGGTKGKYKDLFRINICNRETIGMLLNYMYRDKGNLYLDRKYIKATTEGAYLINEVTLI